MLQIGEQVFKLYVIGIHAGRSIFNNIIGQTELFGNRKSVTFSRNTD